EIQAARTGGKLIWLTKGARLRRPKRPRPLLARGWPTRRAARGRETTADAATRAPRSATRRRPCPNPVDVGGFFAGSGRRSPVRGRQPMPARPTPGLDQRALSSFNLSDGLAEGRSHVRGSAHLDDARWQPSAAGSAHRAVRAADARP